MVVMNYPNGFDLPASRQAPFSAAPRATLCVHFSASGAEHCISFTEAASEAETNRARAARLTIGWDVRRDWLLRGRALLRGEVACDAYLLTPAPVGADGANRSSAGDRDLLRAEGLPRERATLLARMPERPLLATAACGPDLSPQLLYRIHSLLIVAATSLVAPAPSTSAIAR